MNYPIYIGIDTLTGRTAIGARAVDELDADHSEVERVYGCQIRHRCAALVGDRWILTTPTQARRLGVTDTVRFSGPRS